MSENVTGDWEPVAKFGLAEVDPQRDGFSVELTPFLIEANDVARRVTVPLDPDRAPVVVARWREPFVDSLKVFDVPGLDGATRLAVESHLRAWITGDTREGFAAVMIRHGDGCDCHGEPDAARDRTEQVRALRRLYYAAEAAARDGGGQLARLSTHVQRAANDADDAVTAVLMAAGSDAVPAAGALARMRRAVVARARLDAAVRFMDAVPADVCDPGSYLAEREEVIAQIADHTDEEHAAAAIVVDALETADR